MTIRPDEIVAFVGGAALAKYGTLTRRIATPARGGEAGGEDFSRTSIGNYVDVNGVLRPAAANVPRVSWLDLDGDGVREPYLEMEGARAQRATNPETPASWSDYGTPVLTTGQVDPWGGSAALLVEDNDGSGEEGKFTALTGLTDGECTVVVAVSQGTLPVAGGALHMRLHDLTAGVDRHRVSVTWNAAGVAPTLATQSGAGVLYDPLRVNDRAGRIWWLIPISATSIVGANTNRLYVHGSAGATGTFYLAGGNAFNVPFPSSWQGAALGTREADQLDVPIYLPQNVDWTLLCLFHALHAFSVTTPVGTFPDFVELSDEAGGLGTGDNRVQLFRDDNTLNYHANWTTPSEALATRAFTATKATQRLILRHRASDHALQLELDGSAAAYTAAPTSHGVVGGLHRTLRLRNDAFLRLRAVILVRNSHTESEFNELLAA